MEGQIIPLPRVQRIGFHDLLEVLHSIGQPLGAIVDHPKPKMRRRISWIKPAGFLEQLLALLCLSFHVQNLTAYRERYYVVRVFFQREGRKHICSRVLPSLQQETRVIGISLCLVLNEIFITRKESLGLSQRNLCCR